MFFHFRILFGMFFIAGFQTAAVFATIDNKDMSDDNAPPVFDSVWEPPTYAESEGLPLLASRFLPNELAVKNDGPGILSFQQMSANIDASLQQIIENISASSATQRTDPPQGVSSAESIDAHRRFWDRRIIKAKKLLRKAFFASEQIYYRAICEKIIELWSPFALRHRRTPGGNKVIIAGAVGLNNLFIAHNNYGAGCDHKNKLLQDINDELDKAINNLKYESQLQLDGYYFTLEENRKVFLKQTLEAVDRLCSHRHKLTMAGGNIGLSALVGFNIGAEIGQRRDILGNRYLIGSLSPAISLGIGIDVNGEVIMGEEKQRGRVRTREFTMLHLICIGGNARSADPKKYLYQMIEFGLPTAIMELRAGKCFKVRGPKIKGPNVKTFMSDVDLTWKNILLPPEIDWALSSANGLEDVRAICSAAIDKHVSTEYRDRAYEKLETILQNKNGPGW